MELKPLTESVPKLDEFKEKYIIEKFREYDEYMKNAENKEILDMWGHERDGFRRAIIAFGYVITEDVKREAQ
jgi:DNA-directed RNA polymerase subunit N (RpoN/RPB10)